MRTQYTMLQQCLPLAVLKRLIKSVLLKVSTFMLQQCLPLAVLKQSEETAYLYCQLMRVATAPTACGMYHLNSIKPRENHLDLLGVFVS